MDIMMVSTALSGRRRRRSFGEDLKRRMVAECAEAGASVSAVARRHDVNANLLFSWCRQFAPQPPPPSGFDLIPVRIAEAAEGRASSPTERGGSMEIALANGARVRVDASVDEQALRRVLIALKAAR
jgi:transposase